MSLLGPIGGQHFLAPASLRIFVCASDINNWMDDRRAASVEFMVDDAVAATVAGSQSEYYIYKTTISGVSAGTHRIWVRGHFVDGKIFDSTAALITVDTPPAYGQTVNLSADVSLSGAQNYELIGTPTARVRVNGNGFKIQSTASWTGRLTLQYADITNLGVLYDATPGISVTTTKSVDIENCVFDSTNALDVGMEGTATGVIRANEFRSNMFMAVGQYPVNIGNPPETNPAITLRGGSTVPHYFQGNNVGLSNVFVFRANNWLFGGTSDAEGNILMGPRVGIELADGTGMHIRRNVSDQLYAGGWSQGNNFEMNSGPDLVVEENLINGGSWPVRGFGGVFRYNLVLNAGHEWLWITQNNAVVHHNIFAEGDVDVGGVWMIYGPTGVQFYNNTLDGFANPAQQVPFIAGDLSTGNIHSNVFYRFNGTPVITKTGTVITNYNLFDNPGVTSIKNYSDNSHPANDAGALNAQVDPKFSRPQPPQYTTLSRADIWNRVLSLKQILQIYRQYYTPVTGSPLIDTGDPAGGNGNDIGAVGAGTANAADQFGLLDGGVPAGVSVSVLPSSQQLVPTGTLAFAATVYGTANQTVTWSVLETGGGAVNSSGLYTAPTNVGTYHVRATSVADATKSATAAITVQSDQRIPDGFDAVGYLARYPELQARFGTDYLSAWLYYRDVGIYQGEVFDDNFRVEEYLALYPDLFALFGNDLSAALVHWLTVGRIEGRLGRIPPGFSAAGYFAHNPDVARAVNSDPVLAWQHFWLYGIYEGRAYDEEFRVFEYLALNADLQAAFLNDWRGATLHWMRYGRTEGRLGRIPLIFNSTEYLARYPDVAAAWGTDPSTVWLHYWLYGIDESRNFDEEFRVDEYLALNPDLTATYGTNRRGALEHWVRYGRSEGRQGRISSGGSTQVIIDLNLTTVNMLAGDTVQFIATITGTTNTSVTWSITEGAAGGSVNASGLYVAPASAGTFHVVARSLADPTKFATATIAVSVIPRPPAISSFTANPSTIMAGGSTTLSWIVTGATSLSISPALGTVTGSSTTVSPAATTTYTLTATNTDGSVMANTTVTVTPVTSGLVAHPRLWLTPASLAALRTRATASDSAWISLRNACDSLAAMPVQFPDGTGPTGNVISGGYQYFDYLDPAITLGLGYQVAKTVDATRAVNYAAKGRALLLALSDPVHHGRESTDSGWAIRAYGTALALGYDWFYDVLSAGDRTQIYTEINRWTEWYDANGFERDFPQGNYFAGYYCAKALGALATEGDNPKAGAMWNDWLNRLHFGMVQPYYSQWLSGGGWPEGWNYGPNGTLNMLRPIVAAQTAKGLDLLHDATKPFVYPEGHALWMAHFTWPDLRTVDDRGFVYESDNPTAAEAHWATEYAGLLRLGGGTTSPQAQKYARDIRTATADKAAPWAEFLHWNNTAPETDYKVARSYRTNGDGQVSMRSSWATDAVWAAFQSGPYTGYSGAGEQFFDQGALTIKRGGVPFLVNTWGSFMRNSPGTDDSNGWFDFLYGENYGTQTDGVYNGRRIYNTFIATRTDGYWGQFDYGPGETTTTLNHFEDGGAYVVMRGVNLGMMYMTGTPITGWSREVLYVRPNCFLVYDRTSVNSASVNQWQGFHVLRTPLLQVGAAAGTSRYDVVDSSGANAASPLFRGRVSTLLPAGHTVNVVNVANSNKVYRLEVHPPAVTNNTWLTVFDASTSASQAALARPLTVANGGVVTGAVEGSYLAYADGTGLGALFSTTGSAPALPLSFKISTSTNRVVLPDLTPNASYNVTAVVAGVETTVTISSGTSLHASAEGVLTFQVSAGGTISP